MSWKVPSSKLPYNIGGSGVLPRKILKTKNAAEAISGHLAVLYMNLNATKRPFGRFVLTIVWENNAKAGKSCNVHF